MSGAPAKCLLAWLRLDTCYPFCPFPCSIGKPSRGNAAPRLRVQFCTVQQKVSASREQAPHPSVRGGQSCCKSYLIAHWASSGSQICCTDGVRAFGAPGKGMYMGEEPVSSGFLPHSYPCPYI